MVGGCEAGSMGLGMGGIGGRVGVSIGGRWETIGGRKRGLDRFVLCQDGVLEGEPGWRVRTMGSFY